MIVTQHCKPAPQRKTPSHFQPQGKDVKAAAFHEHRAEGGLSKGQSTVMGVLWRLGIPLTRKQIVANCPRSHQLPLSSVCGRVNELLGKGLVECEQTVFDAETRKHVQAISLTESGMREISAEHPMQQEDATPVPRKAKLPGTYAKRAAILCQDYDFCCYLYARDKALREKLRFSDEVAVFPQRPVAEGESKGRPLVGQLDSERAASWMRAEMLVLSRSQIDGNEAAQEVFENIVWDFAQWVLKSGRQAAVLKLMGAQ